LQEQITREEGQKLIVERYRTTRTERKSWRKESCAQGGTRSRMEPFELADYRSRGRMLLSVFLNGSEGSVLSRSRKSSPPRVTSTSPGSGLLGLSCLRLDLG
jgi:hypothetical protein